MNPNNKGENKLHYVEHFRQEILSLFVLQQPKTFRREPKTEEPHPMCSYNLIPGNITNSSIVDELVCYYVFIGTVQVETVTFGHHS